MKQVATVGSVLAIGLFLAAGCEDWTRLEVDTGDDGGGGSGSTNTTASASGGGSTSSSGSGSSSGSSSGTTTSTPSTAGGSGSPSGGVPADFAGVRWLHTNVSSWPQTASLNAQVSGGSILLNYDKSRTWPGVNGLNANPWVFVYRDGAWYAATFEWLRVGQTSKPTYTVAGDHIKKSPLNNFRPVSGETYGFMVSGLARDKTRNVQERSNVSMVRWP